MLIDFNSAIIEQIKCSSGVNCKRIYSNFCYFYKETRLVKLYPLSEIELKPTYFHFHVVFYEIIAERAIFLVNRNLVSSLVP